MIEKIELRKKLKSVSVVESEFSLSTLDKLKNYITNKTVCTYIPLKTEININTYLTTQSLLTTTCLTNNEIKIWEPSTNQTETQTIESVITSVMKTHRSHFGSSFQSRMAGIL